MTKYVKHMHMQTLTANQMQKHRETMHLLVAWISLKTLPCSLLLFAPCSMPNSHTSFGEKQWAKSLFYKSPGALLRWSNPTKQDSIVFVQDTIGIRCVLYRHDRIWDFEFESVHVVLDSYNSGHMAIYQRIWFLSLRIDTSPKDMYCQGSPLY